MVNNYYLNKFAAEQGERDSYPVHLLKTLTASGVGGGLGGWFGKGIENNIIENYVEDAKNAARNSKRYMDAVKADAWERNKGNLGSTPSQVKLFWKDFEKTEQSIRKKFQNKSLKNLFKGRYLPFSLGSLGAILGALTMVGR